MSFEYSIKTFKSFKYFKFVLSLLLKIDILLHMDLPHKNRFYQYLTHDLLD